MANIRRGDRYILKVFTPIFAANQLSGGFPDLFLVSGRLTGRQLFLGIAKLLLRR